MANVPVDIWQNVLEKLQQEIPQASFETWFTNLRPLELKDDSLVVSTPSNFHKTGINRRFRSQLEKAICEVLGRSIAVELRIDGNDDESVAKPNSPRLRATSNNRPEGPSSNSLPLNPDYTFDQFVRGNSNHLAYAASIAVAEAPGKSYNPLFIYGSVGLGKTHLLQAIGNHLSGTDPQKTVVYTTSERFAIELISSIRNNTTSTFREKYRQINVLLVDDVQFLEGKEGTQEELFHTFNDLYSNKNQIVLSSDRPPEELSGLQDRLVSRFRWGLVADIQPPDLETRIAILRSKASNRKIAIDDSILELIANRISSNIRALEGALIKAIAYAELKGEELTASNVETTLPEEGKRESLNILHIKNEVAERYNIKTHDLEGASRKKEISQARHIAIYLAREMTSHSFPAIGKQFGKRDHSTIMHSYMKIKNLMKDTPLMHAEIREIQESLFSRYSTSIHG